MKNWKKQFNKLFPEGLGYEDLGCCDEHHNFIDKTDEVIEFIEKLLQSKK